MMFPQVSPQVDTSKVIEAWDSPIGGYAVFAKTKDIDSAVKLLEYCVSEEALYWNVDAKSPTTFKTGIEIEGLTDLMERNLQTFDAAEKIDSFCNFSLTAKQTAQFNILGAKVMNGTLSGEEFAKQFEALWADKS
jgi:hypothetical protein